MPEAPSAFRDDDAFAIEMDRNDPLGSFRELFHLPSARDIAGVGGGGGDGGDSASLARRARSGDEACIYMCGNSLGCMPKGVRAAVEQELTDWERLGVEAHLHGKHPWLPYHEEVRETGARLVGARPGEVVYMNSLTVNLHLMMTSFYRPSEDRYRIVIEDSAFPSDGYAVMTQAAIHGLDPAKAVVRLKPRAGEQCLRDDDVKAFLKEEGDSVALMMLGGVNYLTGQWFDMAGLTAAGKAAGCVVGWDLAHAAGNVPLKLHDWGVDFAAWCSYKFLNSGPGAVAGCFVHEKNSANTRWHGDGALVRCGGWWGNDPATRFRMGPEFVPVPSAEAWQLSNPPILSMAPVRTSLEIFDRAGMGALREKSLKLTAYMEWSLGGRHQGNAASRHQGGAFEVITPREPERRGCALSIAVKGGGKELLGKLRSSGVVCDFREPNVIRAAPVPLYNTFADVRRFAAVLRGLVGEGVT
jgi:kynureninase